MEMSKKSQKKKNLLKNITQIIQIIITEEVIINIEEVEKITILILEN